MDEQLKGTKQMETQTTAAANNPADAAADIIAALSRLAEAVRRGDPKAAQLLTNRIVPMLKTAGLWSS